MLIKGEKYACDACVRGHRVSSCQHADRPLIHINKKGRPVSQCPHCRGLRKARASHIKCDCAEKAHAKEDCPHGPYNDNAENKDHRSCCCGHGARCTCALKKDHLDTVPEDIPHAILAAALPKEPHKPRLNTQHSQESKLTVFSNGHHKPVHKINDIHNKCGAPYKIPARAHNLHDHKEIAQRSSDSLPLIKDAIAGSETSHYHTLVTSAPQTVRRVKSEHNSPDLPATESPSLDQTSNIKIPPLDANAYAYSPFGSSSPAIPTGNQKDSHFPEQFPDNYFITYEMANTDWEPPSHSGGLSEAPSEVDWSTFNFTYEGSNGFDVNNNVPVPSQPPSYASYDHFSHLSHPGMTSSSEISEVEDFVPVQSANTMAANTSQDALNDFNSVGGDELSEREVYRLSSTSSYVGLPHANVLASANIESLDIDDYLKSAEAQTREMALQHQRQQQHQQPQPPQQIKLEAGLFDSSKTVVGEHPYSIQEAQQIAHMVGNRSPLTRNGDSSSSQNSNPAGDPVWSYRPHEALDRMIDTKDQDDDWVR